MIAMCMLDIEPISVDFFYLIDENKADDLLSEFILTDYAEIIDTVAEKQLHVVQHDRCSCVCVRD